MATATLTTQFDGYLNPEQAAPIFEKAQELSVVQRVARQVALGPSGVAVPVYTGDPTASWVAEGGEKPATNPTVAIKQMEPKKLATIFVASAEVVRANPGNFMNVMQEKVAGAFARAFDSAALHGTNTPFGAYIDQTGKSVSLVDADAVTAGTQAANVYLQINSGLKLLVDADKELNGFLFDPKTEPVLNGAVDSTGRPLFLEAPYVSATPAIRPGRLLGREAFIGKGVAAGSVLGYGGDFTQVAWGVVGGITFDVSDQASVALTPGGPLTSLWQNNLIAVRAEAEYGLLVNDVESFVKYTNTTN